MTRMERIRFDIDLSATQEDHIEVRMRKQIILLTNV